MTMAGRAPEDITSETSLYAIWRLSRRVKDPLRNRVLRFLALTTLCIYAFLPWSSTDSVAETTRLLASIGLPSILGLLGFLLAGYTVFVSIARRGFLVMMSKVTDEASGLSWLKVSMYTFVGALAELLVVLCLMLTIIILGQPGAALSELVTLDETGDARGLIARLGFVACAYGFVHTILVLKSTIRNVHHSIAAAIRWEAERSDEDSGPDDC